MKIQPVASMTGDLKSILRFCMDAKAKALTAVIMELKQAELYELAKERKLLLVSIPHFSSRFPGLC